MNKIVVVVGATATGKTTLAHEIAMSLKIPVISADAFQVYKELNVGINKPTPEQLTEVQYFFINSHSIYDSFDQKIYQDECLLILNELWNKHLSVVMCGGSNLYIDTIIKGYELSKCPPREEITMFDNWSYDEIYKYVLENDPLEAQKITYNNQRRIIRAAQIIQQTQQPKSLLDNHSQHYCYDVLVIETVLDRQALYTKINDRVDKMLNNGWLQEVEALYKHDANIQSLSAFKAIGYKQILQAILSHQPIDAEMIKLLTRRYAKRQLTWNRNKYPNHLEYNVLTDNFANLMSKIEIFLKN